MARVSRMVEGRRVRLLLRLLLLTRGSVEMVTRRSWRLVEATRSPGRRRRMGGYVLRVVEGGRDVGHQRDGQVATGMVVMVQTRSSRRSSGRMVGGSSVGVGVVVMVVVMMRRRCMVSRCCSGCGVVMVMMELRMQLRLPRASLVLYSCGGKTKERVDYGNHLEIFEVDFRENKCLKR